MARRKRNSDALERAKRRAESIDSISQFLDFGGGVTSQAFANSIDDLEAKLSAYNTALSTIDKLANDVRDAEQTVTALSEKMLLGVGSRYGKTSPEYEMAGGSRRTYRRRQASTSASDHSSPTTTNQTSSNGTSATVN